MIVSPAPPKTDKVEALILDALDRLPKTADGIARYFTEQGIKGDCGNASECAVGQYLSREVEDVDWFGVTTAITFAGVGDDDARAINPLHVQQFISGFDAHRYPELIAS